jgi:hypothetical protein
MTYGRVRLVRRNRALDGAAVSHSAEQVRGDCFPPRAEGPLIRPSATFSPRGEGSPWRALEPNVAAEPTAGLQAIHLMFRLS